MICALNKSENRTAMNELEKRFIDSVPESDLSYAQKRLQIKEWYKPFGSKIMTSVDLSCVAEKLNNFSHEEYWIKRECGDFILNRAYVLNELLSIRKIDGEDLLDDYDRYQVVCWLCSEENIRGTFPSLNKYKGDSESEKEFVSDTLSKYSTLMEFWSHYIYIVNENGEYKINPNTEILDNLKELIAKYNKNSHKNLNYNCQVNLWKYGFECAKKEGSIEALEYFFNKLKEKEEQNELDEILIDTALYATSSSNSSLRHSNANVIDFCLTHLGIHKYKMLLQKDFEVCGSYSILDMLEGSYLFGYVKELISCLEPENISFEEYSTHLISGVGRQVGVASDKGLIQLRDDFLTWIWDKEGFEKHREYCLNKLSKGDPGLVAMISALARAGVFQLLEKILNSTNETGRKKLAEAFRNSDRTCCALYIQSRKDLLDKILNDTKYSNNFMRALEKILDRNLATKEKWNEASKLHKEFKIKESMMKLSEILSDGLRNDMQNEMIQLEQIDQVKAKSS